MDLKTFISATLSQILEGVADAQEKAGKAAINPMPSAGTLDYGHLKMLATHDARGIEFVEFDVVVATNESSGSKGGAGLAVGPVVVGGHQEEMSGAASTNHIRFRVPIALPRMNE